MSLCHTYTHTVGDDMGMAVETSLGISICGVITGKIPDDQCFVSAAR